MADSAPSLAAIELQLRQLLPADLYAAVWVDPTATNLMRVFEHLRTLQHILTDYTPRQVSDDPPAPGQVRYAWQEGTLLFADLAGFTPLLEANTAYGKQGASQLLKVLNRYFSEMIEIVSKSSGDLLEFTGDALLVQFFSDPQLGIVDPQQSALPDLDPTDRAGVAALERLSSDLAQAVRAGLRMQRAMTHFANIETGRGRFSLGMRIGIQSGRFLTADIGTPMRMIRVLLGSTVQHAKQVEGAGTVGRVCLGLEESNLLANQFQFEPSEDSYQLAIDNLTDEQLGEYDITLNRRRQATAMLFDRSVAGLLAEIQATVKRINPLASYLPPPILNLLIKHAAQRRISPNFPESIVLFLNLTGFTELVDRAMADQIQPVITSFSRVFAAINAAVSSRGGILQTVTYQLVGSDFLIYFGVLNSQAEDSIQAAEAAIAIRDIVSRLPLPQVGGQVAQIGCRISLTRGAVFAAEFGEARGRRGFNILGDPVNTAARLTTQAQINQILVTEEVYWTIAHQFRCKALGEVLLKGKTLPVEVFALESRYGDDLAP